MFNPGDRVMVQMTRDKDRPGTIVEAIGSISYIVNIDGCDTNWECLSENIKRINVEQKSYSKTPLVMKGKHPVMIDVDDTLIIWDETSRDGSSDNKNRINIKDPNDGMVTSHIVHKRHVEFLKKQCAKGYPIIVWSASGPEWAESVCNALGVMSYIDVIVGKPAKWVDDNPDPSHILNAHVFLDIKGYSL